jgi:hypothetical protein
MKTLLILFALLLAAPLGATTRFAIPGAGATGCSNGSTNYSAATNTCGAGSSTVYTTMAGCLNSFGIAAGAGAGHSCAVRAGTYAVTVSNIIPGGTSASAFFDFYCYDAFLSCRIDPGTHATDVIRINTATSKHIKIRGFELDARGQTASQNILSHGNLSTTTGIVLEDNWFRGGALSGPCIATAELNGPIQIRRNLIEGCMGSPTGGSGSHGMYIKATSGGGGIIENNTIRDNFGMGIQCYPTCNGMTIRKNFISGHGARCILVQSGSGSTVDSNICVANGENTTSTGIYINGSSNAKVLNNIVYGHLGGAPIDIAASGAVVRNNICADNNTAGNCPNGTATTSDNITSAPGFTNAAGDDFSLTSAAAAAINQGTNVTGFPFNGALRDIGPFETFGHAFNAVAAGNTIDATFGMNLNTPLLPATGMTGFTVSCTGTGCGTRSVTSAVRKTGSDSVVTITFDGAACTSEQTWTYSYSAGNVTDSALIGNSKKQPLHAITDQAVTNNCSGTPAVTAELAQVSFRFYRLLTDEDGDLIGTGAVNASIRAANGMVFTVEIQTDCTEENCAPLGQILQFDVNGAASWTTITDECSGTKICFVGATVSDASVPGGVPTCPLSGAFTCVDGGTQRIAAAVPVIDLAQDNSVVNRYLLKAQAAVDEVLRLRLINQNGAVLSSYDQYPTITGRNAAGFR